MKFAVLDFETTGTQSVGEIIQVGLAIIEEDRIHLPGIWFLCQARNADSSFYNRSDGDYR